MEKLISQLNMKNRIFLPGKTDNIKEEIYDTSLFVLSSDYEGMPNALMEAMALGLPVISTDCPCGGPKFLIENKKNGILVPVNDEKKLKEEIENVLKDKELARELSSNANKICIELNPIEINKKWEKYIKERQGK